MDPRDELIQRIVSSSRLVWSSARSDLERELRAHLDDAVESARAEGHDDARIFQTICDRFGSADEIAHELAKAHRVDRWVLAVTSSLALLGLSAMGSSGLILAIHTSFAILSGAPFLTNSLFSRGEIFGIAALTLGYSGVFLLERLFRKHRFVKALVANSAIFAALFAAAPATGKQASFAPALAFLCGLSVRALEHTAFRRCGFAGAAMPIIVAAALRAAPVLSAHQGSALWTPALLRCVGAMAACHLLTCLSAKYSERIRDVPDPIG
jgi:hypothetical protein